MPSPTRRARPERANGTRAGAVVVANTSKWSVYILKCRGNFLYTGIAKNAEARFKQHRSGKGAAFTRINPPLALIYQEHGYSRSAALAREAAIRRMPVERKRRLVMGTKETS